MENIVPDAYVASLQNADFLPQMPLFADLVIHAELLKTGAEIAKLFHQDGEDLPESLSSERAEYGYTTRFLARLAVAA